MMWGVPTLARSLGVKEDELKPLSAGFAGFFASLAGYFLLLPLRDEAGVSLGTDKLPKLFLASLLLTFLATPLVSTFLSRSHAKEHGLQLMFRALSLSILGFVVLYMAAGNPPGVLPLLESVPGDEDEGAAVSALHSLAGQQQEQEQQERRQLLAALAPGAVLLTPAQTAVRVCFFLWVSLLNLVAVSSLWARSADVFSPEAAGRLFGLLGAGATLGQLVGSLGAGALSRAPVLGGGGGSPSLLPLLASAAMLELAGQAAGRYHRMRQVASPLLPFLAAALGADADGASSRQPRHAASSTTSSSMEQGSGSLGRAMNSRGSASLKAAVDGSGDGGGGGRQTDGGASEASGGGACGGDGSSKPLTSPVVVALRRPGSAGGSRQGSPVGARRGSLLDQLLARTLEGYGLIRASPYLMHMCLYLALNYITSSFFYFEKTLVVARVRDSASRTAWFATINSTSALFILALQLLATGRVLRFIGLPVALSVTPAAAGLLMAAMAVWPTPSAVAVAEVLRKVLSYSLARPARESLFTVISREEKYKAKIFLDTVVQRIGDTLAAAAFQTLVPSLGFGPSGMAAACVPVCTAWTLVAYRLGQRQQRQAAAAAGVVAAAGKATIA